MNALQKTITALPIILMLGMMIVGGAPVHAALIDPNLAGKIGVTDAPLEQVIVNIVQWTLGFIGLITVIMVIWGGFQWMTSRGSEDKIKSATGTIRTAVIGMIIILLAWAIVTFVGDAILQSVTDAESIDTSGFSG